MKAVKRGSDGKLYTLRSKFVKGTKKTILWSAVITTMAWSFVGVYQLGISKASAEVGYVAVPLKVTEVAPILKKIAQAESQGRQFDANGLPLMHANTNGSVDLGILQINNRVWGAKAKELGFDLLTEKGNMAMGEWILMNRGTDAWNSSSKSWK